MIRLTQEQCEARMLRYVREFYATDRPDRYLDPDVWPLLAYVVRRTAEDVSVIMVASERDAPCGGEGAGVTVRR